MSNPFKGVVRSRQLNNVMKCLMSRPEDLLSSHIRIMSRQAVSCCDIREKFASWATFNFALNLMTAHLQPEFKSQQVQINGVINSD